MISIDFLTIRKLCCFNIVALLAEQKSTVEDVKEQEFDAILLNKSINKIYKCKEKK